MRSIGDESDPSRSHDSNLIDTVMRGLALGSRLLALIVLAIYLPALLAAGLLVLLTSPGPAFVKRAYRRKGGKGDVVYLYEFRTECWRTWRETPVGLFMRRADLHRLPRLANVLMGEVHAGERVLPVAA